MLTFRQLETFREVMRSRTTQAAAEALRVSQPAVSNAIRQMESQIGFDLFDRVGKRLVPTPDAEEIFRDSEAIFELYNVFAQRLDSRKTNSMGTLRIVCTPPVANALMPPVIRDFVGTRPEVRINLDSRRIDGLFESLETRRADIGFALNPPQRPGLVREELALAQMVCAFPPGHPLSEKLAVTAADLASYPLVLFEPASKLNLILQDSFLNATLRENAIAEVRYTSLACLLAEAGIGPTLVDSLTAHAGHRYKLEYRPLYPAQRVSVCALYRANEPAKRVQTAFLDAVRGSGALAGIDEFGVTDG
ncbi:LysR family transcriptional regulator [Psychromarinibacter halotolerans]|uniref:LysR family transcriptional regulator n=1 Tax=Psychromarinibacter halotolerans TaxID=1775175 RepID=A0ABV7GWJ5_9RHOB|nr:LysR family transcriptional regulator [Psychromarinibacter halotolerans]MDF0595207.1 LysR family transcriptional regulator [Psychromarinibacter halotolerans]